MSDEAINRWMSARPTRNPVIERMRDTFDSYDSWGSNMGWFFALADVVTEIDPDAVPAEWEFRQSPFGSDTESYEYQEIRELVDNEGVTLEVLLHAGKIMSRYDNLLRLAGMNY